MRPARPPPGQANAGLSWDRVIRDPGPRPGRRVPEAGSARPRHPAGRAVLTTSAFRTNFRRGEAGKQAASSGFSPSLPLLPRSHVGSGCRLGTGHSGPLRPLRHFTPAPPPRSAVKAAGPNVWAPNASTPYLWGQHPSPTLSLQVGNCSHRQRSPRPSNRFSTQHPGVRPWRPT